MITLDGDNEIFVVHIATLATLIIISSHFFCKTLITMLTNTKIFTKYFNVSDVFSLDSIAELSKYTGIINHFFNFLDNK